jgi:hypothetical protein
MLLEFIIVIALLINFVIGVCFLMEIIITIRFKEVALVLSQSKLLGGGLGLGNGVRVMIVNEILSFKKSILGCTPIQGFPRF